MRRYSAGTHPGTGARLGSLEQEGQGRRFRDAILGGEQNMSTYIRGLEIIEGGTID